MKGEGRAGRGHLADGRGLLGLLAQDLGLLDHEMAERAQVFGVEELDGLLGLRRQLAQSERDRPLWAG